MQDKIYNTQEEVELAISNFTTLMQHPGWKLLNRVISENIRLLTEQILAGGDEELMNKKREALKAYENVINTPKDQIKLLKTETEPAPSPDPYDKHKIIDDEE